MAPLALVQLAVNPLPVTFVPALAVGAAGGVEVPDWVVAHATLVYEE